MRVTLTQVISTEPIKTIKHAEQYTSTLSRPSKMPGWSYSIPAESCKVGSKLWKIKGSVCNNCYARAGRYQFPNVQTALASREALMKEEPRWVEAMSFLINKRHKDVPYFRWFDSGDLQSVEMLEQIIEVCNNTPDVQHWLPTREKAIVIKYIRKGIDLPDNLNIRLSAPMVDSSQGITKVEGCTVSTVSTEDAVQPKAWHCPSRHQAGKCGDCRACWSKDVPQVDYHKH